MDVTEVQKEIVKLENAMTNLVEEFEKKTGTYVAELYVRRDQMKPWLVRIGSLISVNES